MSGVIINGQKGAPRNCRYVYAHFSSGGLAFAALDSARYGVGMAGQEPDPEDPDHLILNPDPSGLTDVVEPQSPEAFLPAHSLMYPWGYNRVWAGKIRGEFDSVYASHVTFPSAVDFLIYQGEQILSIDHSVGIIKAVGLYSEQKNPDDTRPVEQREMKTMIFMATTDSYHVWTGFNWEYRIRGDFLEGWAVDPEKKTRTKLWTRPSSAVGVWYGLASVSPDGTKLASVAYQYNPTATRVVLELNVKTGATIAGTSYPANFVGPYTTTTNVSGSGEHHIKSEAVWIDCPGQPQGWGTAMQEEDKIADWNRTVEIDWSPGEGADGWYPWACQYDDDEAQTLLIAEARQTVSISSVQNHSADWERHDVFDYVPCVGVGDSVTGSAIYADSATYDSVWEAQLRLPWGPVLTLHRNTADQDTSGGVSCSYSWSYEAGGGGGTSAATISDTLDQTIVERTINCNVLALDLKARYLAVFELDSTVTRITSGVGSGTGDDDYSSVTDHSYAQVLKGRVTQWVNEQTIVGQQSIVTRPYETWQDVNDGMLGNQFPSSYVGNMGSVPDLGPIEGTMDVTEASTYTNDPVVTSSSQDFGVGLVSTSTFGYSSPFVHSVYAVYAYQAWSPWHLGLSVHALSYNGVTITSCPKFSGKEPIIFHYPQWCSETIPKYHGGRTDLEYNVRCYTTRDVNGISSESYHWAVDHALAIPVEEIPYVFQVRPVQSE